jgi:hypothetical protein
MILYKVFQTCAIDTPLGHANRKPTAAELLWQINLGMAFGVKGYTYWTYYPVVNSLYEYYDETACFVDREGKPNETYFIMQKLHKEMQDTAKELAGFDYVGAQIVKNAPVGNYNLYLENFDGDGLTLLKGASVNEGTALLVSELYDGEKGRYGYFFVNATDPIENRSQTVTAEFLKEKRALVYRNGKASFVDFVAGRYEFILGTGEGIFVIPQ